jgi:homoserine O-succinyltransferase
VVVRLLQAPPSGSTSPARARLTCAFVNNMPDGAFDATERQFLTLLDAGAGSEVVEVRRFALAWVPRGERVAARIAEEYLDLAVLRAAPPDLLIVTGSNPLEEKIEDEHYWSDLAELLTWGSEQVDSMLLSCLSAHAALTIFDGIPRCLLPTKCTGVFPQEAEDAHPLTVGLASGLPLPHSRRSTVPENALRRAGYHIALQSEAVGWSVATRVIGRANVVLVQAHPEYEPSSLLREYHRDARRYVLYERDELLCLPLHCVAPQDWEQLKDLHRAITEDRRDPALVDAYPFDEVGERAPWPWANAARRLYANWLTGVMKRSD